MALPGNETERWAPKQAGELMAPAASPGSDTHLSPAKSLSQLPAKADSAYSSFSGSSSVPECPVPWCHGDQAAYLDSDYVTGIYHLSAAGSEPRGCVCAHPSRAPERSGCLAERPGNAPARGAAAPVPPAPSPPRRLDSYRVARHLEHAAGTRSPGRPQDRDASRGQGRAGSTEQDTWAAGRKALHHKDSSGLKNGLSQSQNQGVKTGENGERSLSQEPVKRSNPHVFSRPSSFIFQEYLKTDSVASAPKILSALNSVHAYKIPEEMNSKAYPLPHTNPSTVNDTQESKQYQCVVHKPNFGEADLQSAVSEPGRRRRSLGHARCPARTELHQDLGRDVFEDNHDFRYTENPLPVKTAAKKPHGCTDKYECCDSEGEMGNDVWEPVLNQQAKMQKSSVSPSLGSVEPECPRCGDLDQGNKQCCDHTNQTAFFRPKENATSLFLNEFNKEKQANNVSPDLAVHLEQEQTAAPVCLHKHPPGLQNQPERLPQGDVASEQISRQMTPLLYYLSGGKNPSAPHQRQHQEDSRSLPKKPAASSSCASTQPTDVQRESNRLPKPQPTHQRIADDPNEAEDVVLGSPGSSVDESFKNDYREQLKVAQKRVLRETSFKRKDLQMSLPVRLRKKPSQRSSIEHLRSFSLSSANEDAKLVPPHLQLVEHLSKDEEIRRTQLGRVGGRKRVTKEQKKLCFSEPEKLNQLEDKDVSWSQVRDEITEQDTWAAGRKTLESRGRALSSSGISKTELKQIQHTALIEYMERKISQRPGSSQHIPAPNAPMQKRPCYPKWPCGKVPNPNQSRRSQNKEVFSQVFSEEEFPEVFAPVASAAPPSLACGCHPSPAAPAAPSKHHPSPMGAGSCSRCAAAERSRSPPPATQEPSGGAGCAVPPARSRDPCPGCPSFHDAEKDGCKSHEDRDDNVAGSACCWDRKDLAPETSILVPKNGSKEEPQGEKECRIPPLNGNVVIKEPGEHLEVDDPAVPRDPAVPQVKATHGPTAFVVPQGEPSSVNGLTAAGPPGQSTRDCALPGGEERPPARGPPCPAEQRCEELARELSAQDGSLADVLMPQPRRKTALDLMEGLFPINISVLDKSRRRRREVQLVQENDRKGNKDPAAESPEAGHNAEQREGDPVSMGNQALNSSSDSANDLDDITSKKMELMSRLRSKLRMLWEERELLVSESRECAERGGALEALVRGLCKPNEFERYMMFIGDLEKVVSLLLCLSSRLARVQNAMRKIDGNTDAEEKQSLNERHKLLSRQREDAKDLKENLDRREKVVSGILAKYLSDQQLQEYRHFVEVKTSLLIEQKDLEEQIKLLEEQLENLEKSIRL